jgi:hypothetical protein
VNFNINAKKINITELEYLNSTPPPWSEKLGKMEWRYE